MCVALVLHSAEDCGSLVDSDKVRARTTRDNTQSLAVTETHAHTPSHTLIYTCTHSRQAPSFRTAVAPPLPRVVVFFALCFLARFRYVIQRAGGLSDGGASLGHATASVNTKVSFCGTFFGDCSNVALMVFLLLALVGGVWLVRSTLRKRYARVAQGGFEYDSGDSKA